MPKQGIWTKENEEWLRENNSLSIEEKIIHFGISRDAINRKIRLLGLRNDNKTKYESKLSTEQVKYFEENFDKASRQEMMRQLGITESYYYVLLEKKRLEKEPLNERDKFIFDHYYSMTTGEIAKCLGVTRSVVRNRLNVLPINRDIVICLSCGKEVVKGGNRQVYCPECREAKDCAHTIEWGRIHSTERYEYFVDYYKQNKEKILQRSYDFYEDFKVKNGIEDKKLVSQTQMCCILNKIFPDEEVVDDKFHIFLRSPTTNRLLQLDRYYPRLKLAFEYDGAQHFQSIENWGGEEVFREIQRRDREKEELCIKSGIRLVRIKYDERLSLENIKTILVRKGVI